MPPLLEGWKHKILLAGKYLNVIRECGIEIGRSDQGGLLEGDDISMDDEAYVSIGLLFPSSLSLTCPRFYKFLETAYSHANRALLQLLLRDQQLIPRLRSLKHYFFLSQSSFLTHLLDLAGTELRKAARSTSIVKLQSLLDLVLGADSGAGAGAAAGEDPMFREDVRVVMAESGLYEFLLKVVNVSGVIGGEEGGEQQDGGGGHEEHGGKKERDDKKSMLGTCSSTTATSHPCS